MPNRWSTEIWKSSYFSLVHSRSVSACVSYTTHRPKLSPTTVIIFSHALVAISVAIQESHDGCIYSTYHNRYLYYYALLLPRRARFPLMVLTDRNVNALQSVYTHVISRSGLAAFTYPYRYSGLYKTWHTDVQTRFGIRRIEISRDFILHNPMVLSQSDSTFLNDFWTLHNV